MMLEKLRCLIYLVGIAYCCACSNPETSTGFREVSPSQTGIKFRNPVVENEELNVLTYGYFYNGGGVAAGDINNDGLTDLYFSANMSPNRLYLNKGDFRFEEITEEAGVKAANAWNTGVNMVDINADGWLDIYVCRSADVDPERRRNLLFINNKDLTFTEKAADYGLDDPGYSTHSLFFDMDRDGDLDLFLLNHSVQQYAGFSRLLGEYKKTNNPYYGDKLYRNEGGIFTDITEKAGILGNVLGFGLGVALIDANQDGWSDLYVSNDYNEQDYLYINQGEGLFKESLAEYINHTSLFSMGSDAADINNDGLCDLLTLDMLPEDHYRLKMTSGADNYDKYALLVSQGFYKQFMRNMLQVNNGNGSFSEMGQLAGISNTDWSWSALFADFDNDSHKDLFVANGYLKDYTNMDFLAYTVDEKMKLEKAGKQLAVSDLLKNMPSIEVSNKLFQNQGGYLFKDVSKEWGMNKISMSNGAAYSDLDNDGDLDLVVNNIGETAGIFENRMGGTNGNFLKIDLRRNEQANTWGIGAKIYLYCADTLLYYEQSPSRGFQSSVDPLLHIGLGKSNLVDSIRIIWPEKEALSWLFTEIQANTTLSMNAPHSVAIHSVQSRLRPIFHEQDTLPFRHTENEYIDFKRQALLHQMYSRQGPCLASADVDGDGIDEVFVGGAKDQPAALLFPTQQGWKTKLPPAFIADKAAEDVAAAFFDADGDKDMDLYVASGGYEFEIENQALAHRLYLNDGKGNFRKAQEALPELRISGKAIALADIDKDGDVDLFIGGRLTPGNYPATPQSVLLINDGKGKFTDQSATLSPALSRIGMVTDALWLQLRGDERPELVLVGEWMPITVFSWVDAVLTDVSSEMIPFPSSGWWNTVAAGDLDKDGDMDLVLGNQGLNTQIKADSLYPVRMYDMDFEGNGVSDPVLSLYIKSQDGVLVARDDLSSQFPALKKSFNTYDAYARASIDQLFPKNLLNKARIFTATTFESIILENSGMNFQKVALPPITQSAPVHAILLQDLNSDGKLDLLLAGNSTHRRVQLGPVDANYGLVVLNMGGMKFKPLRQDQSGLRIRGDVTSILSYQDRDKPSRIIIGRNDQSLLIYTLQR